MRIRLPLVSCRFYAQLRVWITRQSILKRHIDIHKRSVQLYEYVCLGASVEAARVRSGSQSERKRKREERRKKKKSSGIHGVPFCSRYALSMRERDRRERIHSIQRRSLQFAGRWSVTRILPTSTPMRTRLPSSLFYPLSFLLRLRSFSRLSLLCFLWFSDAGSLSIFFALKRAHAVQNGVSCTSIDNVWPLYYFILCVSLSKVSLYLHVYTESTSIHTRIDYKLLVCASSFSMYIQMRTCVYACRQRRAARIENKKYEGLTGEKEERVEEVEKEVLPNT